MFKKVLGIISGKRQRKCHCNVNIVKAISTGSYYNRQVCKERQVNILFNRFVLGCFESYEGCSESIRRDFFPRKLMKHGRCAVEGRWRVPSCPYVDFDVLTSYISFRRVPSSEKVTSQR